MARRSSIVDRCASISTRSTRNQRSFERDYAKRRRPWKGPSRASNVRTSNRRSRARFHARSINPHKFKNLLHPRSSLLERTWFGRLEVERFLFSRSRRGPPEIGGRARGKNDNNNKKKERKERKKETRETAEEEREGRVALLFTAVRKACHKGIAGFLLIVRQCEQDL